MEIQKIVFRKRYAWYGWKEQGGYVMARTRGTKKEVQTRNREKRIAHDRAKFEKGSQIYDPVRFPSIAKAIVTTYGARHNTLCKIFGISLHGLRKWIDTHEDFRIAIREGKDEFNAEKVEDALLKRALGYTFVEKQQKSTYIRYKEDRNLPAINVPAKEVTIIEKEIPPDVKAAIYFLQNRRGQRWRNTISVQQETKTTTLEMKADLSKMNKEQLLQLRNMVQQTRGIQVVDCEEVENPISGYLEMARKTVGEDDGWEMEGKSLYEEDDE